MQRELTDAVLIDYLRRTNKRPAPRSGPAARLGIAYNRPTLRLSGIDKNADRIILHVQNAEYHDYIRTNLLLDLCHDQQGQTLRSIAHGNKMLQAIGNSDFADTLGIGILLLTSDGYLVLQHRSPGVLACPRCLGMSVSGTFAPEHLKFRDNVLDMIIGGEQSWEDDFTITPGPMFTETDLKKDDIERIDLLGITRDLIRGGQPSMIFLAISELSRSSITEHYKRASEKYETAALEFVQADHVLPDKRQMITKDNFRGWVEWLYRDPLSKPDAPATPVLRSSIALLVKMLIRELAPVWQE